MSYTKIFKVLIYVILCTLIAFLILHGGSKISIFTIKDAALILVIAGLIHLNFENRFLLKSLSSKYDSSKQILKNICKYCPDLISYRDYKRRYIVVNDAVINFFGKSEKEILGKPDSEIVPSEIREIVSKYSDQVLQSGESVSFRLDFKTDKGERKCFDTFFAPLIQDGVVAGIISISRDITKEEELKSTLLQKQFYMISILDNLPFIAFLKDLDGKIVGANKRLEELSGIKCADLVGKNAVDVLKNEKIFTQIEDSEIIKNKKFLVKECKYNLANTGEAWYRIEKAPILSRDGQLKGITVFLKNIEQEKITETHKETFVATLTHDLKTPTIAQIRMLELLLNGVFGPLTKEQEAMVCQTHESCKYMLTMISDVLSTYKYENGDAKLINQDFDFYALAKECCLELTTLASQKGQSINLKCKLKPTIVFGDRTQLKRVVMNLVSNSISHGYDNTEINVVIEEAKDGIVFTSNNDSPNIPDDVLDKVFEKYVSGAAKFNKVGTGLGLYLSQRIISAHLGSMIASSKNNHTSFGFIIPYPQKAKEMFIHR